MNYYGHGSRINEYRLGIDSRKEVREHKEFLHQRELEKRKKRQEEQEAQKIALEYAKIKEIEKLEKEIADLIGGGL
ncbi:MULTISPECIES: hypothetical protein [unclassified Campylobacter]|uniref:hypothetical protein n=1 Tax=unclassified Campylobacter TaxID=2593542 RepID=UPI001472912F|nr:MULTISPECIES: hypothetical protein [unclassified Campylobacter]